MAQQGTGTPQDPIKTELYFQKKGLVYKVGGGGGGGSSSATYIKTPVILSPVNEATGVSVLATIRVSEYENLFESDAWANRHVQIATVGEFTSESIVYDHMEKATEFQVTEPPLPANTTLYIRAKDYSEDGLESEWSNIVMFTTGDAITVNKPELQLFGWHESTSDFVQTVKATASEFSVTQGQIDNHIKTDWWIEQATTRSNAHIWESMGDTTNLTSITTPEIEALQPSTKYVFCCVYYGEKFGASPVSMKEFTTSDDFGKVNTPTLSVEGGPSDVYETPTLTGTAFSNTRDPDTHISTDWKIVLASDAGASAVWESTSDVANLTTITVPKGKLQTGTSYIAMVRYRGQVYGVSEWAQYQFSTVAVFSSVNTPSLTVEGAPDAVAERPTLTLSAFGGVNVTYKSSHFKILKNDDNSEVWETTVEGLSTKVPRSMLEVSTTYKFQGWHESNEGVSSQVVEVVASTKDNFIIIGDIGAPDSPTFGVGIPSDEEAEAFIPGMTKHPDFYDETKAGYGSWILPSKNIGDIWTTEVSGVLKYIPKFYWHPLFKGDGGPSNLLSDDEIEALVPYVDVTKEQMIAVRDKYPYSGMVFASSSAFVNEQEANAQGFILPAAFIDGGKEKNGFFIAPTLTTFSKDSSSNDGWVSFGETYPNSLSKLWRLTTATDQNSLSLPATLTQNAFDAISFPRWYSNNLCCESAYTVAALALLSLGIAEYSTSTSECAWYDSTGAMNFPKGINNRNQDADDTSVTIATGMSDTTGSIFPTTQDGYCKTTHNGRINGITHVNGWLLRIMVGLGYADATNRVFDCTKYSISSIDESNVQTDTTMSLPIREDDFGLGWGLIAGTPLFTELSGTGRLLNCVLPSPASALDSPIFGNDSFLFGDATGCFCGGDFSFGKGAGIFARWDYSNVATDNWGTKGSARHGFRVIGYSPLNSDGTSGGGVAPDPENPSVIDTINVTGNFLFNGTVISLYKEPKYSYTGEGGSPSVTLHYTDIDLLWDETKARVSHLGRKFLVGTQFLYEDEDLKLFSGDQSALNVTSVSEGVWRITGSISVTSPSVGDKTLWLRISYEGSPVPFDFLFYHCK